ncbi:MAG: TetR/AcrR family transcriptional regulator [Pseudomonadota bacterium]
MPRQAGRRNKDFAQKRQELIRSLTEFALAADLRRPSLREFALGVGVTEPTLRHYFTDRQGTVLAILEEMSRRGQSIWEAVATASPDGRQALEQYFLMSRMGMRHGGFVRTHAFGLIEGLADKDVGRAYVHLILEPSLQSLMSKLRLSAGKPLAEPELRALALAVFSPLLLMSLHQDLLGGRDIAPLDGDDLTRALTAFLSHPINDN